MDKFTSPMGQKACKELYENLYKQHQALGLDHVTFLVMFKQDSNDVGYCRNQQGQYSQINDWLEKN